MAESWDWLCTELAGFRRNRSCEDQILRLKQLISDGYQAIKPKKTVRALLDYSKAFDLVWREDLLIRVIGKHGNIARQRDIQNRILTSHHLEFPLGAEDLGAIAPKRKRVDAPPTTVLQQQQQNDPQDDPHFKVHDYTAALKSVLRDMQEPLLTTQLLPLFTSIATLTEGNSSESRQTHAVGQAKQLAAIRLLRHLLPKNNQLLLRRLLDLLTATLEYSETNRMTSESLGTLFGPILLAPADVCFIPDYPLPKMALSN